MRGKSILFVTSVVFVFLHTVSLSAQPEFSWPVDISGITHLSGTFGEPRPGSRDNPVDPMGHWHLGVDLAGPAGTDVLASATGIVTYVGGSTVMIHHSGNPGWHTVYLHTIPYGVSVDDPVAADQHIGDITGDHCHFQIHCFSDGQAHNRWGQNFDDPDNPYWDITDEAHRAARNPLDYANFTAYPDADNPSTVEIRFTENADWSDYNNSLEPFSERFKEPEGDQFLTHFIVHAYDDITETGATAPYKIRYSIEEWVSGLLSEPYWWEEIWADSVVFDDLLDAGDLLDLDDVYAEGSSMSNRDFYYYKQLDLYRLDGLTSWPAPLNPTGRDQTFRFKAQAFDREGKASEAIYRDLTVPAGDPDYPSAFVDFLSAEPLGDHIEVKFKALWMPGILGVRILRCEGLEGEYRRINPQVIEVPDTGALRKEYSFSDWDVLPGRKYAYKLEMVSPTGERGIIDHLTAEAILPAPFRDRR